MLPRNDGGWGKAIPKISIYSIVLENEQVVQKISIAHFGGSIVDNY